MPRRSSVTKALSFNSLRIECKPYCRVDCGFHFPHTGEWFQKNCSKENFALSILSYSWQAYSFNRLFFFTSEQNGTSNGVLIKVAITLRRQLLWRQILYYTTTQ